MLAAGIIVFAAHVCLGWIREAQRHPALKDCWRGTLSAALAMGSGLSGCVILAISAEPLAFQMGYPLSRALLLALGSVLACLPACFWMVRRQGPTAIIGSGLLLAAAIAGVQASWVLAIGFRPGINWRIEFVATALVLLTIGTSVAFAVAFSRPAKKSSKRKLWRLGGSAILGLTIVVGQELLLASAGLLAQVGSIYRNHVPASIVSLTAGALVPLILSVMATDLELRRRQRRRRRSKDAGSTLAPLPRDRHHTPTASP